MYGKEHESPQAPWKKPQGKFQDLGRGARSTVTRTPNSKSWNQAISGNAEERNEVYQISQSGAGPGPTKLSNRRHRPQLSYKNQEFGAPEPMNRHTALHYQYYCRGVKLRQTCRCSILGKQGTLTPIEGIGSRAR